MSKELVALVSLDKDLIDVIQRTDGYQLHGIFDNKRLDNCCEVAWLGADSEWSRIRRAHPGLKLIVAVDQPALREELARFYGFDSLTTFIASDSYVSTRASIGSGTIVQSGVRISADASIGRACKLNINAVVHHDCVIGDYSTLAPGAQLLGFVTLESKVFIGAGAIVLPHLRIGKGAVVGAGAVVTKDVGSGAVVAGVPAIEMKMS